MKKIILVVAIAMLTVFGASAQEKKDKTYVDGVTNIRIGYTGIAQCADENLLGGVDFGFNIIELGVRPYDNGKISLGVDFNLNVLHAAENYYFNTANHKTALVPSLGIFNKVKGSSLDFISFGFPLNFTSTFGGKVALTIGASAKINLKSITVPPIFDVIMRTGNIPVDEMYHVFNMGAGMMIICANDEADEILRAVDGSFVAGEIVKGEGGLILC